MLVLNYFIELVNMHMLATKSLYTECVDAVDDDGVSD